MKRALVAPAGARGLRREKPSPSYHWCLLFRKVWWPSERGGSVVALVPAAQVVGLDVVTRGLAVARVAEGCAVLQVAVVHLDGLAVAAVEAAAVVVVEVLVELALGRKRGIEDCQICVHGLLLRGGGGMKRMKCAYVNILS